MSTKKCCFIQWSIIIPVYLVIPFNYTTLSSAFILGGILTFENIGLLALKKFIES